MSDIGPGDLVVKVYGPCTVIARGRILRVDDLCWHGPDDEDPNSVGLLFAEYPNGSADPRTCKCFNPDNFRKLNDEPDNAEVLAMIRKCKPAKQPVNAEQSS